MSQISQVSQGTPPGLLKKAAETSSPEPQPLPPEEEGKDSVIVDLSEDAIASLDDGDEYSRPGKSGNSTAHRARALLQDEAFAALRDLPFGQVVSALARGIDPASLLPPPPPPEPVIGGDEVPVVGEEGDTGTGTTTITTTATTTPIESPEEVVDTDPLLIAKATALSEAEAALALLSTEDEEEDATLLG